MIVGMDTRTGDVVPPHIVYGLLRTASRSNSPLLFFEAAHATLRSKQTFGRMDGVCLLQAKDELGIPHDSLRQVVLIVVRFQLLNDEVLKCVVSLSRCLGTCSGVDFVLEDICSPGLQRSRAADT